MAGGDWKDWKLLVVDSDKEFLDWVVSVFTWAGGHDIRSADSPQQAMELLQTFKADGALIGIQLKGMSGVEYLSHLRNRQISSNPDLPVIMVISTADRNALRNACQIGIENFIPKPVDAETLVKRVASTILAPRRFIANRWYFGPDRRRRPLPFEGKDRRRGVVQQRPPGLRPERSLEDMVTPLVDPAAPKEVRRSSLEGVSLVDPAAPRAPGRDIGPLVEAPQAKIARDAGPLVDAPAAARQSRDIGPLVEAKAANNSDAWKEEMAAQEAAKAAAEAAAAAAAGKPDAQVQSIITEHRLWLRSGGKEGKRAALTGMDLHGLNLAGNNLASAEMGGVDLTDANCENADFSGADLRRAILTNANINNARLGVAKMRHSDLESASLEGANLRGADLAGVNFQGASLKGADFAGAIMLSTNLRGADLTDATGLTQAQLDRCMGNAGTKLPPGFRLINSDD